MNYYAHCAIIFLLALFAGVCPAAGTDYEDGVDSVLASNSLRGASWSIQFYSLAGDSVLYEYGADRLLIPASVVKMVISAAAIDRLGPDHHFVTSFLPDGHSNPKGLLNGDLYVNAGGDPSAEIKLSDSLGKPMLRVIADSLWARGLRGVEGDLKLYPGPYHRECAPSSWEIGDVREGFAPAVDGFGFNNNVCRLAIIPGDSLGAPARHELDPSYAPVKISWNVLTGETDSDNWAEYYITPCQTEISVSGSIALDDDGEFIWVSIQDPALYFGRALRAALERRGIHVTGEVRVVRNGRYGSRGAQAVYQHSSLPLMKTLRLMNKESDNYSSEYMLRALGIDRVGVGTSDAGLKAVNRFLRRIGVELGQIRLVDGCGLARRNLVSARALTTLLAAMHVHPDAESFKSTLSISGVDGTLDYRMGTRKLRGKVRAKTGTMTYVSSLAGYLELASGEEIAFAMIGNNHRASRHFVRGVQDAIIEMTFDEFNSKP